MRLGVSNGSLISTRQAAELLGVHRSTVSRAVRRGYIVPDAFTPTGRLRFRESEILKLRQNGWQNANHRSNSLIKLKQALEHLSKSITEIEQKVLDLEQEQARHLLKTLAHMKVTVASLRDQILAK